MDNIYLFDHIVIFRNSCWTDSAITSLSPDFIRNCGSDIFEILCKLFTEGLKDRASLVCHTEIVISGGETIPAIGIKYIGQRTFLPLTQGPQSNSPAGEDFRNFWGEKSELRLIDGDLCECVVWPKGCNVCLQIIDFIMTKKLGLSRGPPEQLLWHQLTPDRLNPIVDLSVELTNRTVSSLRLIRAMDKFKSSLRGLNDKLPLNITGILPISSAFRDTSVFPPVLSIPSANRKKKLKSAGESGVSKSNTALLEEKCYPIYPLYVVITLEQSGKWPDDLEAYMHMKRLLIIRIHELLSPLGIPSHVTKENMLDVFLDGLVFRISLAQLKELYVLRKSSAKLQDSIPSSFSNPDNSTKPTESHQIGQEFNLAVQHWIRLNQNLPALSGTLTSVSRTYAHVFPLACRLAKRWLSSHGFPVIMCPFESELDGLRNVSDFSPCPSPEKVHLSISNNCVFENFNHIGSGGRLTEIAVELLVIYAAGFSGSSSSEIIDSNNLRFTSTGSAVVAFIRFLNLLATYEWDKTPIFVDLNEGFSDIGKRRLALDMFKKTPRDNLPAMVICTPLDLSGIEWTSISPSRAGLRELQLLAAKCRDILRAMLVAGASFEDLKAIFSPLHKKTDLVIKLKKEVYEHRKFESVKLTKSGRQKNSIGKMDQVELPMELPAPGARYWPGLFCYDPVAWFAKLLQLRFDRFCEIRWDRHGGDWVAFRWRPNINICQSNVITFDAERLNGLTVHVENAITESCQELSLIHKFDTLMKLLPIWAPNFIESIKFVPNVQEFEEKFEDSDKNVCSKEKKTTN